MHLALFCCVSHSLEAKVCYAISVSILSILLNSVVFKIGKMKVDNLVVLALLYSLIWIFLSHAMCKFAVKIHHSKPIVLKTRIKYKVI